MHVGLAYLMNIKDHFSEKNRSHRTFPKKLFASVTRI